MAGDAVRVYWHQWRYRLAARSYHFGAAMFGFALSPPRRSL
jgi:hypothetical protein